MREHALAVFAQPVQGAVLNDLAAAFAHRARQFGEITIRPQRGVAAEAQCTGHAGFQRRLLRFVGAAVDRFHHHAQFAQQRQFVLAVGERAGIAIDVILAGFDEFALQCVTLHPVGEPTARIVEQRMLATRAGFPVTRVAAPGEAQQPAPQQRIETRRDVQRRVGREHPLERGGHRTRRGQRRRVAGGDGAAIAVRGAAADGVGFDHAHAASGFEQGQRGGQTVHAAARDEYVTWLFHANSVAAAR